MHYFILMILFSVPMITPLYHRIIQDDNTDKEHVMYNTMKERALQDKSAYTVEGTITKVSVDDLSIMSNTKNFVMELYLKTPDSPHEDLKFTKRPVFEADKRLRVGQRVSIIAKKNEFSEYYADILHIEPL